VPLADDGDDADGHWPLLVLRQADASRRAVLPAALGAGHAGAAAPLTVQIPPPPDNLIPVLVCVVVVFFLARWIMLG
jgi:hypothetical protein